MSKLLQNACYIPEDNFYLVSTDVDEPNIYTYKDKKVLAIKGNLEFAMRGGDFIELLEAGRYVEWCLTDEDTIETIDQRSLIKIEGNDKWELLKNYI